MKRLFPKGLNFRASLGSIAKPVAPVQAPIPPTTAPPTHTTGLQPKYTVPPVPHPCPYDHISVLATVDGLLLRPRYPGESKAQPISEVRIEWGKGCKVEAISADTESENWEESVVVYGLVGFLEIYSASYLLVISSRSHAGHLLDNQHAVYGVKGVTAIPLVEERARSVLATLATRNKVDNRTSLLPSEPPPPEESAESEATGDVPDLTPDDELKSARVVKFADEEQVKVLTPLADSGFGDVPQGPPSPASIASTPSSENSVNTDTVVKTLADRLSFWTRLSKRKSTAEDQALVDQSAATAEQDIEPLTLDEFIKENATEDRSAVVESIIASTAPPPATVQEQNSQLEDKIVRECIREFTRGGMYFAYTFDITRSLQHKQELVTSVKKQNEPSEDQDALDESKQPSLEKETVDAMAEPSATLPLWRRVDRRFWWNEWLSKPLVDAGLHPFVLPIMQGFVQASAFSIPRDPVANEEGDFVSVEYIVVSRRSRDRAGLRYQRRGIDDDAHVANFVETETIMCVEREGMTNVFSHVQIRGSIPLFWDQQGYSLKPAPQLSAERSHDQNLNAIRQHFTKLVDVYGPVTVVNLAEQHGKEGQVTTAYGEYARKLNSNDVRYEDYDFHSETRGMKYENIARLIERLERIFESQGYFWVSNNRILSEQHGVFRVNCIDGLDRTNVVESTFARHVLNRQLGAVALLNPEERRAEVETVFNDVWANNGDAISRAYAGTSALKGDFTRTGKRDLAGLLNDGVNSLARMYSSTFADWFSQAVIDFMLGNRTTSVFSEFLLKLQSSDPRDIIRIAKIRADAIGTCVDRILPEGERLLSGWTLFAPEELNVRIGDKFEEKVLLLTAKALYNISYDYTLEKVKMYTRVPLGDIVSISTGAYILSPLEEASRDSLQNAGFVVSWHNNEHQDTRVTTYSMKNSLDLVTPPASPALPNFTRSLTAPRRNTLQLSRFLQNAAAPAAGHETVFAAFKALPVDPARARRETGSFIQPTDELAAAKNCREAVDLIVNAIRQACADAGNDHRDFVTEADVVSLAEAQRMTSVYAKMEYGVKRLLWLGS